MNEESLDEMFDKYCTTHQHRRTRAVDIALFGVFIPQNCSNPGVSPGLEKRAFNWRGIFLTSASLPPKILPFLFAIPQLHSGTQSIAEVGNSVTTSCEVLEEWSCWGISFQEFVVWLNSTIVEGVLLFESLPPRAQIRSSILVMACWILRRECCESKTLTTSCDVML